MNLDYIQKMHNAENDIENGGEEIFMQCKLIAEYYNKKIEEVTNDETVCWICEYAPSFRKLRKNGFRTKKTVEFILYGKINEYT